MNNRKILGLLKQGFCVEQAREKLTGLFNNKQLFEEIEIAKHEIPGSNFADVLANFIISLEPKNNAMKNLQQSIIHDADLACLLTPAMSMPVTESKNNTIKVYIEELHKDLQFLRDMNLLEQANVKLYIRARQSNTSLLELKSNYIKKYKTKSLLESKQVLKAVFAFNEAAAESKYKLDSENIVRVVYQIALENKIEPTTLLNKYKEIFLLQPITENKEVECVNCDGTGKINENNCAVCEGNGKVNESFLEPANLAQEIDPRMLGMTLDAYKKLIDTKIKTSADHVHLKTIIDIGQQEAEKLHIPMMNFVKAFKERFQQPIGTYVLDKETVHEDVIPFAPPKGSKFYNKHKEAIQKTELDELVKKAKDFVDHNDMSFQDTKDKLLSMVKLNGKNLGDFLLRFSELVGEDFYLYYLTKSYEDKGAMEESIDLDELMILTEGIDTSTAHKARNCVAKLLRKYVDSSDINLLSNFESYDGHEHLSLKINLYQATEKHLQQIVEKLIECLDAEGFKKTGAKTFEKQDVIIRLTSIRKVFRSGAYKNREMPCLGIEILGPRKRKQEVI